MPDYIDFDPDGDVVLILPKAIEELDERSFKRLLELLDEDEDEEPQERAREVVDEEPDEGLPEETNEAHSSTTGRVESPASSSSSGGSGSEPGEVRMRVSSKHLTLVSPVFKSLLKGGFLEAQALSSAGTAEVSLPDDDPQALEILLNIIHGRSKKVPLEVSVAKLTELAILVDKYGLHEVSQMYSAAWIDSLKESLPTEFTEELLQWMWVSRVFSKPECFAKTTKIALLESESPLYNNAETTLPIPESVLGKEFLTSHNASCSLSLRHYRDDTGGNVV
jgi:BTB/POZ domain